MKLMTKNTIYLIFVLLVLGLFIYATIEQNLIWGIAVFLTFGWIGAIIKKRKRICPKCKSHYGEVIDGECVGVETESSANEGFFGNITISTEEKARTYDNIYKCPNCHHQWQVRERIKS